MLSTSRAPIDNSFGTSHAIDPVVRQLQRHVKAGAQAIVPDDLLAAAVRQFWMSRKFDSLHEARLVSFGLSLPIHTDGRSLMDDRERFLAVLDRKTGVDQWIDKPRWYRRCYQGLVRSYFTYDRHSEHASKSGRQNWGDLRDYLKGNVRHIVDTRSNPDWVGTATSHTAIFGEDPCVRYADAVLSGDSSIVDVVCAHLSISKASWFLRELILAQVKQATLKGDREFASLLPKMLGLLGNHPTLRDRGMVLVLDRYAGMSQVAPHLKLRDTAVDWWGNPWLPSNESRWGGVRAETRAMVSDWLKREFVEAFFEKLAKDGVGDRRRANFWLRYVKAMDNIQFALGADALSSRDKDFVVLRKKMEGLYTKITDGVSENNAFIMTMGKLIAVEFGSGGNAFYGYDADRSLPFDASMPVRTAKNARNSLKSDLRLLWLLHKDNIHGWTRWEDMFDATLFKEFSIRPNTVARRTEPTRTAQRAAPGSDQPLPTSVQNRPSSQHPSITRSAQPSLLTYSKEVLEIFAMAHGLNVDDLSSRNGNVWVRYHENEPEVTAVLRKWGFQYKADKGWWRLP